MVRKRRHIRQVQTNRRYGALCAGERVRIKLLLRHALALFVSAESKEDEDEANLLRHAGAMVIMRVQRMRQGMTVLPPTVHGRAPVIEDITVSEAWTNYRSPKAELRRLFLAFNFPYEHVRTRSGGRYPAESAFLILLRRLRYPGRWQDLQVEFGREYTQLTESSTRRSNGYTTTTCTGCRTA
ncbi:unnamed protein product [Pylaiella littoralis]